jgi:hypothetical protein
MSTKELRELAKAMRQAPLVSRLLWEIHRLRKIAAQAESLRRLLMDGPKRLYGLDVTTALDRLGAMLDKEPSALEERQRHAELLEDINKLNRTKPRGRDPKR